MKPVARTDRLLKQSVDQEMLVYDPADDTACCLNSLATFVWRLCDGKHSVEEITDLLSRGFKLPYGVEPEDAVWEVLDELKAHRLLVAPAEGASDEAPAGMRRRDAVKLLAAIPLFPAIQGITAPITKQTTSPAPTPTPSTSGPGVTQTNTPTATQTPMVSPSVSQTPMITPSLSQTPMITPSVSQTPMITPSVSQTPMVTPTSTPTPTPTPT